MGPAGYRRARCIRVRTCARPAKQRRRTTIKRRKPMSDLRTARVRPDPRERFARQFFRIVNPMARWMMSVGIPTGSRNILLTVRGRRSGTPRTTPLSMLELEDRRFVQASYSEDGWVRNLRAAGQATVTDHGRDTLVQAVELPPEKAEAIIRRTLEPY